MELHLDLDCRAVLPGYAAGDCFVTWHARYQKSVAYHEAGHAVAFIAADHSQTKPSSNFRTVQYVEALGAMGGQVGLGRPFMDYSGLLGTAHPPIDDIDHRDFLASSILVAMERDIVSYLSGPYAQSAFEHGTQPGQGLRECARRVEEAQSDFATAAEIYRTVCRISQRPVPFTELERRALRLVSSCWTVIDDLAGRLLVARYLEGDEVYSIVSSRLPACDDSTYLEEA